MPACGSLNKWKQFTSILNLAQRFFSFLTTRNSFRTRTFLKCLSRKLITILTSLPPAFFTHEWHYTWHQMFCCWLNFNPYWKSHALKSKRRKYQKNAFRFFLPLLFLPFSFFIVNHVHCKVSESFDQEWYVPLQRNMCSPSANLSFILICVTRVNFLSYS